MRFYELDYTMSAKCQVTGLYVYILIISEQGN